MFNSRGLGVGSICCLLHSLLVGGSTRQWIAFLGRHVEAGGRATIFAPRGPLAVEARAAGIGVVAFDWTDLDSPGYGKRLWRAVGQHEVAVVHWDHRVMDAFEPALEACGRAALTIHQTPTALARWFGPEILDEIRRPIELAIDAPNAVALVRGEAHARRFEDAFGFAAGQLNVLPASIPAESIPFEPRGTEPVEILAMTRLSPDKEAIPRLAVELTRTGLEAGRRCRLTVAGEGPWRAQAIELCERRLPAGSWRVEGAPDDPIGRLADSDLVVAQGLTTLEAAALGRRVIVARSTGDDAAAGAVLTPARYDEAARDPFGEPALTADSAALWDEILALGPSELREVRRLVERHNSLGAAGGALRKAFAATAPRRWPGLRRPG
jgi:hypothetical protein